MHCCVPEVHFNVPDQGSLMQPLNGGFLSPNLDAALCVPFDPRGEFPKSYWH